jgi:hypothetical protein
MIKNIMIGNVEHNIQFVDELVLVNVLVCYVLNRYDRSPVKLISLEGWDLDLVNGTVMLRLLEKIDDDSILLTLSLLANFV